MKRIVILHACNSVALVAAVADFSNLDATAAANSRVVEGKMTIPYGLWPVEIVNAEGKKEKVLQRLDKAVAGRLVSAFNSLRGRLSRFVSGSPIYMGHPDYAAAKFANAWTRFGKCVGMEAGEDSLTVTGDFTPEAKALLAANEALAPSPHWGLARTAEKKDDLSICEPIAFYSMGITPRPNIAGAAVNEDPNAAPAPASMMDEAAAAQQLADCCAEIVRLESALAASVSCQASSDQQVASLTKILAEKEMALTNERSYNASMRADLEATRAALQRAKADALSGAVNSILDGATAAGRILATDREVWREKITKTPAAANELFAPGASLKTASVVEAGRIAGANEAAGGRSATDRFVEIVRQHMAATNSQWDVAWNECKAKHAELFKLMPNGGKV